MFLYYRYLDKFHCEPNSIVDLFEFLTYNETDNKINSAIMAVKEVK